MAYTLRSRKETNGMEKTTIDRQHNHNAVLASIGRTGRKKRPHSTKIRVLLGNKEKPKSDEFLQVFENHIADGAKQNDSHQ